MAPESLLRRMGRRVTRIFGRRARPVDGPPAEPVADLRRQASSAVLGIDTAIGTMQDELVLAQAQLGAASCERFVTALDTARDLSLEAFTLHRDTGDIAQAPSGAQDEERQRLARVIDIVRRADAVLDAEAEELSALRAERERAPALLDDLADRATEVERRIPAAQRLLEDLRAEHSETDLDSVGESLSRATRLVLAGRDLIASGRAHLGHGDHRASAVSAARAAEDALGRAEGSVQEVEQARESLATADEDVRQALNSIHADLNDVRRFRADDPRTTAAVERARPIITTAGTARRKGGDLLASLADLEAAEQDIDEALAGYREAAGHRQRAQVRLERRLDKTLAYVRGVGHRGNLQGGVDPRSYSLLITAERHCDDARSLLHRDLSAAADRIEQAMSAARTVQGQLDANAMATSGGPGGSSGDGILDVVLGGIVGGSDGSSGGFGGGGRF